VVVGAGAFVLVKLGPVIALSSLLLNVLIGLGVGTAILCSFIALGQVDTKRVISYTLSAYIGMIFIAVGTQSLDTAKFMLFNESFGMALLYMSTGAIIWTNITQDITQMGGLWKRRPITAITVIVGAASIVGIPPLGGFWGILQLINELWLIQPWLVPVVILVNGITTLNFTRLFCLIFLGKSQPMSERSPEPIWLITVPNVFLAFLICHIPIILAQAELIPSWNDIYKPLAIPLVWSTFTGLTIGSIIYLSNGIVKPVKLPIPLVQDFFTYDLYVQRLYQVTIVAVVSLSSRIINWFDRYIVDGFVNLIGIGTLFSGQALRYSTSGQSQLYVLLAFSGLIIVGLLMSLLV
jgi:NAD(P)H-quinone oxidoreductase subunit 5